jgi:N-acetylneuraminic acid mutarotase
MNMTKNVKVRATLKGTLSLMGNSGIKEEGQIKIHQDIVLANITYEQWMERYDEAMTLLKTGTSPRQEVLVKGYNESVKRYDELYRTNEADKANYQSLVKEYHEVGAQLKEATKEIISYREPQTPDVETPQTKETKPTTKKKAVSKKKSQ